MATAGSSQSIIPRLAHPGRFPCASLRGPPGAARLSTIKCNAIQNDDPAFSRKESAGAATKGNSRERSSMRLEKVERLGEESWAGVAAVDRGSDINTTLSRAAALAGGDIAAILIFSAIGRGSHAELDGFPGVLLTAWPFLAGWCIGAISTGAYGADSQQGTTRQAAVAAGKAWCIAIIVSLALRSIAKGAPPPLPFAIVASVATSILLVGWRSAFATFMPRPQASAGRGNKSGNPFEFLQLLGSLTKRW